MYTLFFILQAFLCFGHPQIRGVNLGGWLVMEPWITPSKFENVIDMTNNEGIVDQWTLEDEMQKNFGMNATVAFMESHWSSWVRESDIKQLAGLGITHIRVPIGYWIWDRHENEPWIEGGWKYLIMGMQWACKYNIKVLVDLHGVPGSQNGFDNSGKRDQVEWGTQAADGSYPNIDRTVKLLTDIVRELLSEPSIKECFWGVELVNEPASWAVDINLIQQYYIDMYQNIRAMDDQLYVVIHDAFNFNAFKNFFNWEDGYYNVILDTHIYQVFAVDQLQRDQQTHLQEACKLVDYVGGATLWTIGGEFCLATTDCAYWLNGVGRGTRWEGTPPFDNEPLGSCDQVPVTGNWTSDYKEFLGEFANAQMYSFDTSAGWFFWNFKTEREPQWDFMLLSRMGIIKNPPDYSQDSLICRV